MKQIHLIFSIALVCCYISTRAQNVSTGAEFTQNIITTTVPFILIVADAQSVGTGLIGVAASDLYMHNGLDQNPALLSRGKRILGFQALNYSPWLRSLVPDINLYEAGGYVSLHKNHTIGISGRLFRIGTIMFTDNVGNEIGTVEPFEYYLSARYAIALSKHFSAGIGIKYIHSNITGGIIFGDQETKPGTSVAGNIGIDYRTWLIQKEHVTVKWNLGLAILNMGSKISYVNSGGEDFIPQKMKLGTMFTLFHKIDDRNRFAVDVAYQAQKLLVPTPPVSNPNEVPKQVGIFETALNSFSDAEGGFDEEMHEIIHQFGMETRFVLLDNKFLLALRSGHFNEHETKGNRKFITAGVGLGVNGVRFDISNRFVTNNNDPLNNTWNFSIGCRFNLDRDNFFKFIEESTK